MQMDEIAHNLERNIRVIACVLVEISPQQYCKNNDIIART